MLKYLSRYMFQFVNAKNGNRSDPFVTTPAEVITILNHLPEDERASLYVLPLIDVDATDPDHQEAVYRFPLFLGSSFVALEFAGVQHVA